MNGAKLLKRDQKETLWALYWRYLHPSVILYWHGFLNLTRPGWV